MSLPTRTTLQGSRYNFVGPTGSSLLLYNSASGAVLSLQGPDAASLANQLGGIPRSIVTDALDSSLLERLTDGGFVVEHDVDEVANIRERFRDAVDTTPAVLTLTTTMDCNLGCYYCYEERSPDRLESKQVTQVVELARGLLVESGKDSLHVDWYGGEPLLNLPFLELASDALQKMCAERKAWYSASVISNGTLWPADVRSFLVRNRIRQVQISFDGMRDNHDKRRKYRKGYSDPGKNSSFDQAVKLVDELV
jgi:uncharacterized protein